MGGGHGGHDGSRPGMAGSSTSCVQAWSGTALQHAQEPLGCAAGRLPRPTLTAGVVPAGGHREQRGQGGQLGRKQRAGLRWHCWQRTLAHRLRTPCPRVHVHLTRCHLPPRPASPAARHEVAGVRIAAPCHAAVWRQVAAALCFVEEIRCAEHLWVEMAGSW